MQRGLVQDMPVVYLHVLLPREEIATDDHSLRPF